MGVEETKSMLTRVTEYWWPETKTSEESTTSGSSGTDSTKSTINSMDENPDITEGTKSAFLRNRFDILKNCLEIDSVIVGEGKNLNDNINIESRPDIGKCGIRD